MKKNIVMRSLFVLSATALSAFGIYSLVNKVGTAKAATPCIVTIFGVQYDVAPLKTGHSGGDVFICNTDMSAVYQGMHGTNVSRMVGFKVSAPAPSTSPTPSPSASPKPSVSPSPSSTPVVGHDDDDEDEHDDRDDLDEDENEDDEDDHHKQVKEQKSEHKESKDKSKSRSERDDD